MGFIVLVVLICVCRARNSSQPLFSALRLQEEEAFLCATEMPGARQRGNKGVRMNKPTGRGGGNIQAPAGSSRSWVGPATFSRAAFLTLHSLLPPTPRTSSHTLCPNLLSHFSLQLPAYSILHEICLGLSAYFLPPARRCDG